MMDITTLVYEEKSGFWWLALNTPTQSVRDWAYSIAWIVRPASDR